MAKVIPMGLTLDDEVAALVTRVGADKPKNNIVKYSVDRIRHDVTVVTVQFIADGEFCKTVTGIEVTGLDSPEPEFIKHAQGSHDWRNDAEPLNEDGEL